MNRIHDAVVFGASVAFIVMAEYHLATGGDFEPIPLAIAISLIIFSRSLHLVLSRVIPTKRERR